MKKNIHISVISPVYRAEKTLHELVKQIEAAVEPISKEYEIILVEDSGPDNSRQIIREICAKDAHVKGVFLSKNFGQQYALNAGLDAAQGEWIVTLDCDLQDTPAVIQTMYNRAQEGYDIVLASRQQRQDGVIKRWGSHAFNKVMKYLTEVEMDESIANFILYNHKVVDAMKAMGDYRRYYPLMNKWVGFRQYVEPIPHAERTDGLSSSYTLRKRINLAVETIIAFSDKPLRLMMKVGVWISALSIIAALVLAIHYLCTGIMVDGWLTLFVSIWFVFGVQMALMGLVGVYIGKIYEQSKGRPSYIVSEQINFAKDE